MTAIPSPSFSGYVTTHASVAGLGHDELERVLGFSPGTLRDGFVAYELSEPVGPGDFEWKDRTSYSGGWHFDRSIGEYVQRADELRAHLGKNSDWNETRVDRKLDAFKDIQVKRLNVHSGPERIVKIIPNASAESYPDSPFRNIPQWRLTVSKRFIRIGGCI